MHRHGYKGRKFGRETDQRRALIKGLADSLVLYESIETTLHKAKEVVPYVERLITKAKKGDLHNRRQVVASLQTLEAAHKLVDDIAPKLKGRVSGHLRIERTDARRGDNAQLARISFVVDISTKLEATSSKTDTSSRKESIKPAVKAKPETKKTPAKKPAKETK
jgi:large subunit ribosomal protein L17